MSTSELRSFLRTSAKTNKAYSEAWQKRGGQAVKPATPRKKRGRHATSQDMESIPESHNGAVEGLR